MTAPLFFVFGIAFLAHPALQAAAKEEMGSNTIIRTAEMKVSLFTSFG
jgi:hypothetical protein